MCVNPLEKPKEGSQAFGVQSYMRSHMYLISKIGDQLEAPENSRTLGVKL